MINTGRIQYPYGADAFNTNGNNSSLLYITPDTTVVSLLPKINPRLETHMLTQHSLFLELWIAIP